MSTTTGGLLGGALVGVVECGVVQPFDMVKTRHHLEVGQRRSTLKTLIELYREGGVLRYYRGVLPELAGMVPKNAAMYASYDAVNRSLPASPLSSALAGACSGPCEAVVVQPFQVIKVRMQSRHFLGMYSSSFDCIYKMIQQEGTRALARGFESTCWRNVVWNSIYFGSMAAARSSAAAQRRGGVVLDAALGFLCGFFATIFNAPFDVAKSRQQSWMGDRPYDGSTFATLSRVAREEGLSACWAGFVPKAIRMGLAGLVGLTTFEMVQWLTNNNVKNAA